MFYGIYFANQWWPKIIQKFCAALSCNSFINMYLLLIIKRTLKFIPCSYIYCKKSHGTVYSPCEDTVRFQLTVTIAILFVYLRMQKTTVRSCRFMHWLVKFALAMQRVWVIFVASLLLKISPILVFYLLNHHLDG